jgi:radical SAM protein with 4Fe4S-binding SPASM domain
LTLITQAKKSKIYTSTSTNGHFIDHKKADEIVSSGLDRLIISIDGLTQKTYEQYRVNGKLNKVVEASKLLVDSKNKMSSKTPHLIFQFLAVKPNEHEIPSVFDLAKEIGIDEVRIKTAQLYDYKNGNRLMPDNSKYSRYIKRKDGTFKLKGHQGNHCWRMWSGSVFTWDGGVVPCCFDKDASHILGSLQDKPFKQIWNAKKYREFRQSILKSRGQIDICKNCSEGSKVWV